jgi:hypothetical protein
MALDPVTALLEIGGKVIDRVWADPVQASAARLELIKIQQNGELAQIVGQMDINKAEAANPHLFVAGWRPFVGWVCGAGFGVQFVIGPIGEWLSALAGHPVQFPKLELDTMMPLLFGMLGLGAYRTAEKIQGVTK